MSISKEVGIYPSPNTKYTMGFTLLELMVALGVLAILVQTSLPMIVKLRIVAARSEAKINLNNLYTLQKSFYAENDRYNSFPYAYGAFSIGPSEYCNTAALNNQLGFRVSEPCRLRYMYRTGNTHDPYNEYSSWTGQHDPSSTSVSKPPYIIALSFARDSNNGVFVAGKGFSFPNDWCDVSWLSRYRYFDTLVMNQDKEFGFMSEGYYIKQGRADPHRPDAVKYCVGQ